jgi:hypothetical protein
MSDEPKKLFNNIGGKHQKSRIRNNTTGLIAMPAKVLIIIHHSLLFLFIFPLLLAK